MRSINRAAECLIERLHSADISKHLHTQKNASGDQSGRLVPMNCSNAPDQNPSCQLESSWRHSVVHGVLHCGARPQASGRSPGAQRGKLPQVARAENSKHVTHAPAQRTIFLPRGHPAQLGRPGPPLSCRTLAFSVTISGRRDGPQWMIKSQRFKQKYNNTP